ncbi:uncharacterized protein B0T15DRAFT_403284 [Chaetomium strumarium]|uniref:CENP-V/GFA domain-containing protein n=1 Tax=Chaetomium strumarium TaxID=1170767 RepID=A0AAJ0GL26_9PEZI|nr:hypothetical protein B0T15DRAFT_403284 [Chaetomium strumarium]
MSVEGLLRGGCTCGRNRYIIQFPKDPHPTSQVTQVLFHSHPPRRSSHATATPYLRVPLPWYHSTTLPLFPDETNSQIHRVYVPPHAQHTMRHFCGFCGTPLSFWSEEPRDEADFIHLALASLSPRSLTDLEAEWDADLEDIGVLPGFDSEDDEGGEQISAPVDKSEMCDASSGLDTGTSTHNRAVRLGTFRTLMGWGSNRSGTVRVEWEVIEWSDDGTAENPLKRKLDDVEGAAGVGDMEGLEQ